MQYNTNRKNGCPTYVFTNYQSVVLYFDTKEDTEITPFIKRTHSLGTTLTAPKNTCNKQVIVTCYHGGRFPNSVLLYPISNLRVLVRQRKKITQRFYVVSCKKVLALLKHEAFLIFYKRK